MPSDPLPSNQGHIPIPKEFPFTHLSGIWAYVFGPDHRRSRILALFEFWSRRQPKECGVVSIPASYGWISDNLDGEYSPHEVAAAMVDLQAAGLITRSIGPHERKSSGRRSTWIFPVDAIKERIGDAIAGADGNSYGDWKSVLRKELRAGRLNHGTRCCGSPVNHGTPYSGPLGSDHGTACGGGMALGAMVSAETTAPGAVHKRTSKRSTEEKKKETPVSNFPSSPKAENLHTEGTAKQEQDLKVKSPSAPPQPRNEFQEGFRGRIFAAILKAFPGVYPEENRTEIEACCDHPIFVANWRTIIHKNRHLRYGDMWPFRKAKDGKWNFVKIHQRTYDSQLTEADYKPLELKPWERHSDHKMALEFRAEVVGLLGQPEFQEDDWSQSDHNEDDSYEDYYDGEIDILERRVAEYENLSPEKRYSTRRKDLEDRAAGWLKKPEFIEEWKLRLQDASANSLDHGPLDWLAQRMIGDKKKFDDREEQLLDRAQAVESLPQEFWNAWRPRQDEAEANGWDQRELDWLEQQVVLAEQAKRSTTDRPETA